MRMKKLLRLAFCVLCVCLVCPGPAVQAQEEFESGFYEESGAAELYDGLDGEAKDLLDRAGAGSGRVDGSFSGEELFHALSEVLRSKLLGPGKALAALLAVIVLCRLAGCFDSGEAGDTAALAGALACAAVVVTPLLELIRVTRRAVESASVFLTAAVPVYGAMMAASGSAAAGSSYSFFALAAGNAVPILSSAVIFPLLHAFLALALVSILSQVKYDRLSGALYGFSKWLLVLAVTVFSTLLSVMTVLNAQVDAVSNKAARLVAASAIPIVGGAFGDAVAAIQNSVQMVKSGVGAFGILAALCIFAPAAIESALWIGVCGLGQFLGELFETPKIAGFLGMCGSAAKMILAVIASTCAVCVVSAAVVLFVRGSL